MNPNREPVEKAIWDRGSAAHALILNSGAAIERIGADSWRTDKAKEARDAARAAKKIPILAADYDELLMMRGEVVKQLDALEGGNPFHSGKPEVVLRWRESFVQHGKVYEIWCRARMDWLNTEIENAYDVKTSAASMNPATWSRYRMWDVGAPTQAAMYMRGLRRLSQIGALDMHSPDFLFLGIESKPPYCVSLVNVPSDVRQRAYDKSADEKLTEAMVTWANCLETGVWPGYPTGVHIAEGARSPQEPRWAGPEAAAQSRETHINSEDIATSL